MKKENRSHILFRYIFIIVCILLFSMRIVYKAFDNTVLSAPQWNAKAMEELSRIDTIKPERGDILSDNGQILATNLSFYTIRIDYRCERFLEGRYLMAMDSLADSLAHYFPVRTRDEWYARLSQATPRRR